MATNRGQAQFLLNRDPCFFGEQDYHAYLNWLGETLQREQCALVEAETYRLLCQRYIELNPVQAATVTDPARRGAPPCAIAAGRL